ncbi:hypothetical protein KCU85_g61, partial [Aureobasidium melanogenum]
MQAEHTLYASLAATTVPHCSTNTTDKKTPLLPSTEQSMPHARCVRASSPAKRVVSPKPGFCARGRRTVRSESILQDQSKSSLTPIIILPESDGGSSHNLRRLLDMDPCLVQAPRTSPQNMNKAIQKDPSSISSPVLNTSIQVQGRAQRRDFQCLLLSECKQVHQTFPYSVPPHKDNGLEAGPGLEVVVVSYPTSVCIFPGHETWQAASFKDGKAYRR